MEHKEKLKREASIQGTVIREMIAHLTSGNGLGKKIKSGELRKKMVEPAWKVPEGYRMTEIKRDNFVMEWLQPEHLAEQYAAGEKVLLQLHGGGYVGKMRNAYRDFAVRFSELGADMPVLTIDYRVAPENPYPAALEDAYSAWEWLMEQGYTAEQIIVAGDSAGGGLAMALCMYLKKRKQSLPCGIIAMSPWTDLTASGESYKTNYEKDPLFGNTKNSLIYNRDYVGLESERNPLISPLFGDFTDFPPMLIQVGSYEMLLSDSQLVAKKAREQGVKVRLSIYEGMFHVFQMAMDMMPESRHAWKEVGRFLDILKKEK